MNVATSLGLSIVITTEGQNRISTGSLLDSNNNNNNDNNNNNNNGNELHSATTVAVEEGSPLISDETMYNITIYVNFMLRGSIAAFGAMNNIINMTIFYRMGFKDSMSVGLMALSFADFVVDFLSLAGAGCILWDALYPDNAIDPLSVDFVAFGWLLDFVYLCSGWITTMLSVERCVCVVFPFKVKQIFTRMRCLGVIVFIYVVHVAVYMPVFLSQRLGWTTVAVNTDNGTAYLSRMIVMFSDNRAEIQIYIDIANGAVLLFPSQIIMLVSVVWMVLGLRVSSRVRNARTDSEEGTDKKSKLSYKESRLVKVVLFLAIIQSVGNLPRFIAVYAKQIFPDVSFQSLNRNVYVLLWNIAFLTSLTNCSVNVFVYLIVNTNYREQFKALFRLKKKKTDVR